MVDDGDQCLTAYDQYEHLSLFRIDSLDHNVVLKCKKFHISHASCVTCKDWESRKKK